MALSSSTVWEVRTGGSDNNGGGFVSGGTDRSQQTSSHANGTNLTVHASDNTKVQPDGHSVVAADVGNLIQITAGASWTLGFYEIAAQDGTYWTLDRSPAATSTSGGTWYLGGALATPGKASGAMVDGNTLYIGSGTYTITNTSPGTANGPIKATGATGSNSIRIEGYGSSRGDWTSRPTIDAGTQTGIYLVELDGNYTDSHVVANLKLDGQDGSGNVGVYMDSYGQAVHCEAVDCPYGYQSSLVNSGAAIGCYASSCTTGFYFLLADRCRADSCDKGFHRVPASLCLATNCTSYGFDLQYGYHSSRCTAYNTTGPGFRVGYAGALSACLSVDNSTYGFEGYGTLDQCASYNNTSGRKHTNLQWDFNAVTLTADPFVDASGGDFRLNNTSGGGADCRGQSSVWGQSDEHDIGATQHAESSGAVIPAQARLLGA